MHYHLTEFFFSALYRKLVHVCVDDSGSFCFRSSIVGREIGCDGFITRGLVFFEGCLVLGDHLGDEVEIIFCV